MKRLLFLSMVVCSVIWALSARSQTTSSSPPDPSMIYGYIAMVDSVSGARINPSPPNYWLSGFQSGLVVVFGPVSGGEERRVVLDPLGGPGGICAVGGSPLTVAGGPHVAYRYQVRLVQDGYANDLTVLNDPPFKMIRYNPGQWRYRRVEVSPCIVAQRLREGGWPKEVSRRAEPFSDLPDNLP